MTAIPQYKKHWRQELMVALPAPLRILLQGASGRDLIKTVEASILLYQGKLLHLESGKTSSFDDSEHSHQPVLVAKAVRSLLADLATEVPILLLLPANEFLATSIQLPGIAKENLAAALKIQSSSILPSFEKPLSLAINPDSAAGGGDHIALWMTEERLADFFNAFQAEGLYLAAVKPRLMQVMAERGSATLIDSDERYATLVSMDAGVIRQWLHINKADLEQEEFAQQWQQAVAAQGKAAVRELNTEADYREQTDKTRNQDYTFFPAGALRISQVAAKGKRLAVAVAAVAAAVFVAAVPFLLQSLEMNSLSSTLQIQREMASDARLDQAVVVGFENEWGSLNDFPEQGLRAAMFTLQNILSPEVLSSLEVSEGLIKIQGSSDDPQAILQKLEMDPMFTEVVFSRATNNNRYYIDLRLSAVNFEAYMVRYFPDA